MTDQQSTSRAGRQDVAHPVLARGAQGSKTTSSATNQREEEGRFAADEDKILRIPDFPKPEDLAMLSAAELEFCKDLSKAISDEGIKLSVQRGVKKQTGQSVGETGSGDMEKAAKEVDRFLAKAQTLANTKTHIKLLFLILHRACGLAVSLLSADEAFRALEVSGEILHEFLGDVKFFTPPTVEVCEMHLKAIEVFRKHSKELESAAPSKSAKVTARFYLCTSAYQHKVKWNEYSQNSVKEAKKILQKHFKTSHKRMTLYGQACFHLARHLFALNQREALNSCLKQSFDAFFSRCGSKTSSNASIADLYSLPLNVFHHDFRMMTINFTKHVGSSLLVRGRSSLTPSEKILNIASRIWIASLLGNTGTKMFRKEQTALTNLDLSIPPQEYKKPMTDVLLLLIKSNKLPNVIKFKKTFFPFVKDLCLLNKNLYIKFKLLHDMLLAVLTFEEYTKHTDFYLDLCTCFTSEMEKETLYLHCGWMNEMLACAHLFVCYVLAAAEDYDNCLHHANRALVIVSGYTGYYRRYLEYMGTRAHYISAFSFFKKKDHDQAIIHCDQEIALLEVLQSHYPESLHASKKHKAFLESGGSSKPVPAGLNKLFMEAPDSTKY